MTKTISLSDEAYHLLKSLKKPGESFSDVTRRLATQAQQTQIRSLAGAWNQTPSEASQLKQAIYQARDESLDPRVDDS